MCGRKTRHCKVFSEWLVSMPYFKGMLIFFLLHHLQVAALAPFLLMWKLYHEDHVRVKLNSKERNVFKPILIQLPCPVTCQICAMKRGGLLIQAALRCLN